MTEYSRIKPGHDERERRPAALESDAEAQIFLPHQAAMLARPAVDDHEAPRQRGGSEKLEAGAATRQIHDLAIDGGRLRVEDQLAGLRDRTARPDTRISAIFDFAIFDHGITREPPYRMAVKAGLMVRGPGREADQVTVTLRCSRSRLFAP